MNVVFSGLVDVNIRLINPRFGIITIFIIKTTYFISSKNMFCILVN